MNEPADQAERLAQHRRLESEIFSQQSDLNRLKRQQEDIEMEMKRTRDSIARLEAEMSQKESAKQALDHKINLAEVEIGRLKKHMNAL